MSITTSAFVVKVIIIIWLTTLFYSILIMIGGSQIFKKASVSTKTAFYPIINLFTLMELSDISTFLGILLFIPGLNILVLMYTFFKLGKVFNMGLSFKIGLTILPIIFYPLLAFGNYRYKATDEKYFRALDDARGQKINLMTEEEIQVPTVNNDIEEEQQEVDSVFKRKFEVSEKAAPYKAVKINLNGMNKLRELDSDETFKPKLKPSNTQNVEMLNLEGKEDKKDKDFEVIDL